MPKPSIITPEGKVASKVPEVKAVHPAGSTILVEMLNPNEMMNTSFYVDKNTDAGPPQAYILEIGPGLKSRIDEGENIFLNEGDRVILQGTYVPVPNWNNGNRNKGLVEYHNVKAIVEEK